LKSFFVEKSRAMTAAAFCVVVLLLLVSVVLYRGVDRKVKSADVLSGKWVGNIPYNDASGREFNLTMRTALFFLPGNTIGSVLTFPTGAIGGAGRYQLKDSHLTVHCTSLSINGHDVPMATFSHAPWFNETAVYTVTFDGTHLTLTPVSNPTPAPCYPLLTSAKPIVLSRIEAAPSVPADPAPKE
jgi:hypothetical protein